MNWGRKEQFALLLMLVKIITGFALAFYGNPAFYISSMAASLTGISAVVLNLAELAGQEISLAFALMTLLGIIAVNLLGKFIYCLMQAHKEFAKWLAIGFSLSLGSAILVVIFF